MPVVPGPENFASESELAAQIAHFLPENCKKPFVVKNRLRCVPLLSSTLEARKAEPKQYLWIRANGDMPDDQLIHQYLLGYASDWAS